MTKLVTFLNKKFHKKTKVMKKSESSGESVLNSVAAFPANSFLHPNSILLSILHHLLRPTENFVLSRTSLNPFKFEYCW